LFEIYLIVFAAGVIDQDYRGNVGVVLFNFSDKDFTGIYNDSLSEAASC